MNRADPACVTKPTSDLLANMPEDSALASQWASKMNENAISEIDNTVFNCCLINLDAQVFSFILHILSVAVHGYLDDIGQQTRHQIPIL